MPRKAYLPDEIHNYNFKHLSKTEKDPKARIRMLGMFHLQTGATVTFTAKFLNVREATVRSWIKSFAKSGLQGLYDKPGRGRKPKLPSELNEVVFSDIQELQNTRKGGRVKGLDIIELIYSKYGIRYKLSGVYLLLHRIGLSWVSARSKHPNSSIETQEEFKKNFT